MAKFNEWLTVSDPFGHGETVKLLGGGQGRIGFHSSDLRFQIVDLMYQTVLVRIGGCGLTLRGRLLDPSVQRFESGLCRSDVVGQ